VNIDFDRMWEEANVAKFEEVSRHIPRETEENDERPLLE
jgi:hypothetical protein